jgi:hypothetical protein
LSINRYLRAYRAQKDGAAHRGIAFELTFKEWCDFWGNDVDRRGNGPDDLQMQRFADTGPYAIGNIRKGTPKQNMITAGHMKRKRASERAHVELQAALDRAMFENHEPEEELDLEDDGFPNLGLRSSLQDRYNFRLNH